MGKYNGQPYDSSLRQTEIGSRLYGSWKKVRRSPHCEEFDNFADFYDWAIQSGYSIGMWLRLIDEEKPYSPDNCFWYVVKKNETETYEECSWNRTVNRIRKYCGMKPLEGTTYDE